MKLFACFAAAVVIWLTWTGNSVLAASDGTSLRAVNGSVTARDGQSYTKVSTVNGDVRIGRGASADEAETVNGSIQVSNDARLGRVSTVNGSLDVADGVVIAGEASTVNGDVDVERAKVGGDVTTVSGNIDLDGSEITGGLRTVNGDIELAEGARVHGGIIVKKNKGWSWKENEPVKVRICSTCVVDGELHFERPVELRVDSGGKIGQVIGENVTRR
jgi:DUF4097 and DUF4098 domain-containing protein YvlB